MLDNPNISQDKIFEILSHGEDVIVISFLVIILLFAYIYRDQIKLFLKYGFSKDSKDRTFSSLSRMMKNDFSTLDKKEVDDRVENLLSKFNNPIMEEDDKVQSNDFATSFVISKESVPKFRSLKTIRNSNEIIFYFVFEGCEIHDLKTRSDDGIEIEINPKNRIENNDSGYIKIDFQNNNDQNEFRFVLTYYNEADDFHQLQYFYSFKENKLSEL